MEVRMFKPLYDVTSQYGLSRLTPPVPGSSSSELLERKNRVDIIPPDLHAFYCSVRGRERGREGKDVRAHAELHYRYMCVSCITD
jgi:hypothetical protein